MNKSIVLDASVTLAVLLDEDRDSTRVDQILTTSTLCAPSLWRVEIASVLLSRERRKVLTEAATFRLIQMMDALHVELVPEPEGRTAATLVQFARPHQLTGYDALYLELAMRRNLPLFTRDNNLRAAAHRVGVSLV